MVSKASSKATSNSNVTRMRWTSIACSNQSLYIVVVVVVVVDVATEVGDCEGRAEMVVGVSDEEAIWSQNKIRT